MLSRSLSIYFKVMKLDFKAFYFSIIVPELMTFKMYSSYHQVPKILKICINRGLKSPSSSVAGNIFRLTKELDFA